MSLRFKTALIACVALALAGCTSGVVKRVSEPAASLQQLTVQADGSWMVALRLQNYSSMPMQFTDVSLALTVNDVAAGTLATTPAIAIGGVSADVIDVRLQPSSQARLVVADALASNRTLAYALQGTVSATPEEQKPRTFQVKGHSTLNQAPGLPGVLR